MKTRQLLFFALTAILLVSCGSEEKRINKLIADASKSMLYFPDSYDPIDLQIDTLFTDIITEKNIKKANRIVDIKYEIADLDRSIDDNQEDVLWWKDQYYSGDMVRKYQRKVESDTKKKEELIQERNQLYSELKDVLNEQSFCGFVVEHRFRAKNNLGNVSMSNMLYILNKEKTEVIASYDESAIGFQIFLKILDEIAEEL